MNRYARIVSKPAGGKRLRIGVVGAGMAGLTAARILSDQGHDVVVVEKARGAGGRMSTRRNKDLRFDHGAQYFTARDPRFLRHVLAWQERGLVQAWVLQASPQWSLAHLEKSADEVRDLLLDAARELPLAQSFTVESAVAHRWRYALAKQPLDCGVIWLGSKKLALAGDWCHGSRVEGAFLSGTAAAGRVMAAHYLRSDL